MHKGRPILPYLSGLAVLFLLAQLMLAATHVHFAGAHGVRASTSASHGTAPLPAGPEHPDDPFCPLCWTQAAASSLLVPPATAFSLPSHILVAQLDPRLDRIARNTAPSAFRPRAPPSPGCA